MSEFKQYLDILADSCEQTIQQMTEMAIDGISIEDVECENETYPIAHEMAYFDSNETVDGIFMLALGNEATAVMLASAIGTQIGLSEFKQFNDDAADLLNEFINVVVGRAISGWDDAGFTVEFETPVFKKDIVLTDTPRSQLYRITIGIKSDTLQADESSHNLILYVTFVERVENSLENVKILVVDDSRVIRGVIARTLKKEGCKLEEAEDGEEAITIHNNFHPDLTMMDINMPKKNGLETIAHIRKFDTEANFIILSSSSKREEVLTAKSLGVLDYIIKPIKPELLVDRINNVLGKNVGH
jgi:CheY-like chemotaxis protein/CheY-specific phosphatase CheX